MGKGDGRRPAAVPEPVLDSNWERTFGAKKRATPPTPWPGAVVGRVNVEAPGWTCAECGQWTTEEQCPNDHGFRAPDPDCRECGGWGCTYDYGTGHRDTCTTCQ